MRLRIKEKLLACLLAGAFVLECHAITPYEYVEIDKTTPVLTARSILVESRGWAMIRYSTPVNSKKKYSDLSKEEQVTWRALQYEEMPDDDIPPYPADGLQPLLEAIVAKNISEEVKGLVVVHVEIGPDGTPRYADLLNTPSKKMGDYVLDVAMQTKYTPAKCKGVPCTMSFPLRVYIQHIFQF
jgi:hypothetical protein